MRDTTGEHMRILGIDYGSKRVGLALSDPSGTISSPLKTLDNKGQHKAAEAIAEAARTSEAGRIVLGLPLKLDGSAGPAATTIRNFAGVLRQYTEIPVTLWDERLTTARAERAMLDTDMSRARRAKRIDKVAAQMILQSYLDSHASQRE